MCSSNSVIHSVCKHWPTFSKIFSVWDYYLHSTINIYINQDYANVQKYSAGLHLSKVASTMAYRRTGVRRRLAIDGGCACWCQVASWWVSYWAGSSPAVCPCRESWRGATRCRARRRWSFWVWRHGGSLLSSCFWAMCRPKNRVPVNYQNYGNSGWSLCWTNLEMAW